MFGTGYLRRSTQQPAHGAQQNSGTLPVSVSPGRTSANNGHAHVDVAEVVSKSPRHPHGDEDLTSPLGTSGDMARDGDLPPRSPRQTASSPAAQKALLATVFLAVLAVENSASMLARRYAVGVIHLKFSKNAVLAVNEMMKLVFSIGMIWSQQASKKRGVEATGKDHGADSHSSSSSVGGMLAHLRRVVAGSRPMAVPAVVYLIVNLISYPALERINASVFTAISQLKVLATAMFAVLMLRTSISGRKWRTLTVGWCRLNTSG